MITLEVYFKGCCGNIKALRFKVEEYSSKNRPKELVKATMIRSNHENISKKTRCSDYSRKYKIKDLK